MRTTHNAQMPGTEETGEGEPTCKGWTQCVRCMTETSIASRIQREQKTSPYLFLKIARDYKQAMGSRWSEMKTAFKEMYDAGILSAQLYTELEEYCDFRIEHP